MRLFLMILLIAVLPGCTIKGKEKKRQKPVPSRAVSPAKPKHSAIPHQFHLKRWKAREDGVYLVQPSIRREVKYSVRSELSIPPDFPIDFHGPSQKETNAIVDGTLRVDVIITGRRHMPVELWWDPSKTELTTGTLGLEPDKAADFLSEMKRSLGSNRLLFGGNLEDNQVVLLGHRQPGTPLLLWHGTPGALAQTQIQNVFSIVDPESPGKWLILTVKTDRGTLVLPASELSPERSIPLISFAGRQVYPFCTHGAPFRL